ncbi:FimB/Mfa2 family fimbrial subunit [Parabacteroides distasonis]|uniref:FimB/Mfa2 family fimbrial subunit n=1 Tax=Parabacteroides distasonis TaxID=823 RepID=UPI0021C8992C|nr:FimB/Mfa2 family fimbrial subunit [Parabacteroides distasonis]
MRIRSVHPVTFIMLLACCLIGCDSAVFDNLSDCPQGVNFHFYSQTPCEQFPNYPSDIRQVRVFAFDEKDVLVSEFSDKKAVLSADYSLPVTLRHTGKLTFVAWEAVTWRLMIFLVSRKASRPSRKCGSRYG